MCKRLLFDVAMRCGNSKQKSSSLMFPAHILNAESEYGKVSLPHLQNEYGELGVNMAT
jgi:hypothetical protein